MSAFEEMLDGATENLKSAMQRRSECKANMAHSKDLIAHHKGELLKAERLLERMTSDLPVHDENVSDAFDFYRFALEQRAKYTEVVS